VFPKFPPPCKPPQFNRLTPAQEREWTLTPLSWYTAVMTQFTEADVLDRVLDPFADCLTPEVAERIVRLRADAKTQARLDELADRANEGRLTLREKAEYDKYLEAFHFITILQAKARRLLPEANR
jgi:hypothetical protein